MKRITVFLIFLPVFCFAQEKNDNCIIVRTAKNAAGNFNEFAKHLQASGFTIEFTDEKTGTIRTGSRRAKNTTYKLLASCADSMVTIMAETQIMTMALQPAWTGWKFATSSTNLNRKAWEDFEPVLKEFGDLVYLKR